jgi:hypothetical protein
MRNKFFFNKNLFELEEDESKWDEIDYEISLRKMASNVMLKISSLLELVHTNNGGEPSEYIPFSLEAALLLSASITFDLHDNHMSFSTFSVYCECCKTKIYNEPAAIHTMSDVMKSLPDAMFCHKLGHFIDGEKIQNYLFDRNFEYTLIKHCCPHDYDTTPNDSCIGNDQEFLDGFNSH